MYRPVMKLKIRPLTPNLWPALEDLFGENGACNGCWCMYWRIGSAYRKKPRETNKAAFHEAVKRGPPPGLLAFDGELAIGGVSLHPAMPCRGLIVHGDSGVWTMCPSGRSLAFMYGRAIASRALHPR
jgi:hypothetical protein